VTAPAPAIPDWMTRDQKPAPAVELEPAAEPTVCAWDTNPTTGSPFCCTRCEQAWTAAAAPNRRWS
jgi:hypothetical protein